MARKTKIPKSAAGDHVLTKTTPPLVPAGALHQRRPTRIQIRDLVEGFRTSSEKLSQFAVQLLIDPAITAVNFISVLPFLEYEVPLNMLVVDLQAEADDRIAFDVVSERPRWDADHEGLVQLALHHHRIRMVEIDQADIDAEPRASNCKLIWSHRDHPVPTSIETAINRALTTHQALTARSLGTVIGLRHPVAEISALHCQGVLAIDLSVKIGPNSVVRRAPGLWSPPTLSFGTSNNFEKAAS